LSKDLRKHHKNTRGDILETSAVEIAGQGAQVFEMPTRRGDRAVEGARLEIVCTPKEYRGFESPPLRHIRITRAIEAKAWL
jgi:hypothetical protein